MNMPRAQRTYPVGSHSRAALTQDWRLNDEQEPGFRHPCPRSVRRDQGDRASLLLPDGGGASHIDHGGGQRGRFQRSARQERLLLGEVGARGRTEHPSPHRGRQGATLPDRRQLPTVPHSHRLLPGGGTSGGRPLLATTRRSGQG